MLLVDISSFKEALDILHWFWEDQESTTTLIINDTERESSPLSFWLTWIVLKGFQFAIQRCQSRFQHHSNVWWQVGWVCDEDISMKCSFCHCFLYWWLIYVWNRCSLGRMYQNGLAGAVYHENETTGFNNEVIMCAEDLLPTTKRDFTMCDFLLQV